ncbi:KaiC domain-containing protein, partial [Neisseria meningitidis]
AQVLAFVGIQPFAAGAVQQGDEGGKFLTHICAEPEEAPPFVVGGFGGGFPFGGGGGVGAGAAGGGAAG